MPSDDELLRSLGDALAPAVRVIDAARVRSLRIAALASAPAALPAARPVRWRWRALAMSALGAAAVAAAFVLGGALIDDTPPADPVFEQEFAAVLVSPDGRATAQVSGVKVGIGRIVSLETDDLPILPKGDYYEVWFVGPQDAPGAPDRISAGTFHPDAAGDSAVELTAAVDPAAYPALAVTAEPGDGDPAPSGPDVLLADLDLTPVG